MKYILTKTNFILSKCFFLILIPIFTFSQSIIEQESYEVYKACLIDFTGNPAEVFLIKETTGYYKKFDDDIDLNMRRYSQFNDPPPVNEKYNLLVKDYLKLNITSGQLHFLKNFNSDFKIEILKNNLCKCLFNRLYCWKKIFYKRYKNSGCYYEFSKIAFSSDFKYALLYMSKHSAPKAASGHLVLCEKKDNKWLVKHVSMIWMS